MKTKRFVGRVVMIAALAAMTAGVMPAPTGTHCISSASTVPNIHTYDEQSSNGNLFEAMWDWLEGLMASIL